MATMSYIFKAEDTLHRARGMAAGAVEAYGKERESHGGTPYPENAVAWHHLRESALGLRHHLDALLGALEGGAQGAPAPPVVGTRGG